MTPHDAADLVTRTVAACSILHTLLPPWEFLDDFPKAKKYYKLVVYLVGYIALNARSSMYRSISIYNGNPEIPEKRPTHGRRR